MKKKLVSVLLCTAMVTGLLAGCGGGSDDKGGSSDGGKETITMWCPPLDDNMLENWEPLLEDFKEENNCEIDIQIQPWENYEENGIWARHQVNCRTSDICMRRCSLLTSIPEPWRT